MFYCYWCCYIDDQCRGAYVLCMYSAIVHDQDNLYWICAKLFKISTKGYWYGCILGGWAPETKGMLWSCSPLECGSSLGLSNTCWWKSKTYCISRWIWGVVDSMAWMTLNWAMNLWWPFFERFPIRCNLMIVGAPAWSHRNVWMWSFYLKLIYNSWKSIGIGPSVQSHSAPKIMSQPPISIENMWVIRW